MKQVTTTIKIQDKNSVVWIFKYANSITVESRFDKLTDPAHFVLPKKVAWKEDAIEGIIVRGGKVEIWAGYDFEEAKIFEGYISEVHTKIPFEIALTFIFTSSARLYSKSFDMIFCSKV